MGSGNELRSKVIREGKFIDDFNEKSPYWDWRIDNYAGFNLSNSILQMYMGPTEALYYSNAEIADGSFDDLPWRYKTLETKVRLRGRHYGSAGWGFWNHTMVVDTCQPIWFIYLRSRGTYPLNGFFAQVGNIFQPIILFEKNYQLRAAYLLSKLSGKLAKVKILSLNPSMQDLNLEQWHVYKVEWGMSVKFYIDGEEVAHIPIKTEDTRARADIWIDNAVFIVRRGDAGRVYRHVTQENRGRAMLEVDYVKIY